MSDHGTRSRYVAGCRGPSCRSANAEYQRLRNYRLGLSRPRSCPACGIELEVMKSPSAYCETCVHGTATGYKHGCRCALCTQANTNAVYDYMHRSGRALTKRPRPSLEKAVG